jgi:hypothetical protein
VLWVVVIVGMAGGLVYRCSPTFDYSAEVLFDTKSVNASRRQFGVIRYGTDGYEWEVNWRKSDAQSEMTAICVPQPYELADVSTVSDSSGVSIAWQSFNIAEPSILMRFNCLDK